MSQPCCPNCLQSILIYSLFARKRVTSLVIITENVHVGILVFLQPTLHSWKVRTASSKQSCGKICSEKLSHLTFIRMQTIVKFKYKIDPDFFLNFSICFTFKPDLAKCQASVSSKSRSVNSKLQPPPIVCQGKILSCLLRLFFCQQQVTVSPT